jgi:hypothetical protein
VKSWPQFACAICFQATPIFAVLAQKSPQPKGFALKVMHPRGEITHILPDFIMF